MNSKTILCSFQVQLDGSCSLQLIIYSPFIFNGRWSRLQIINQRGKVTGSFWTSVIDFIFPPVCAGCGTAGSLACAPCQEKIIKLIEPLCQRCGQLVIDAGLCKRCTKVPPTIDKIRSAVLYTDPVNKFVHAFKYYDQFALAKPLAALMLDSLTELSPPSENNQPNLLVPVPLHPVRERERGYNQSYLLAAELSQMTGIPVLQHGLKRTRPTEVQAHLDLDERTKNVTGAFEVGDSDFNGKSVYLIDDVCTTGATLFSAADCLKTAGAQRVTGLTVARALKN